MDWFVKKLCSAERDRMTAAEICIDECLTIMDRHGVRGSLYSTLRTISSHLNGILRDADGIDTRHDRLLRVRQALTDEIRDAMNAATPQASTPPTDCGKP